MHTCKKINLLYKELPRLIRTLRLLGLRKRSAIKLSTSVFRLLAKFVKTNGAKWTAQRMKAIFSMVAGEFSSPPHFIRGFDARYGCLPSIARHLIRAGKHREVLTALSVYRKLSTGLNPDISSITDQCVGSEIFDGKDKELFQTCLKQLIKHPCPKNEFKKPILQYVAKRLWVGSERHFPILWSSKMGPNGPAMGSLERDLAAIENEKDLFRSVSNAWKYFKLPIHTILKRMTSSKDRTPVFTSRLVAIPGPACKTRVVALCDYFSQVALAHVHGKSMKVLRMLPFDGTKSHRGIAERLRKHKGVKYYSIDLSAATDRFPVKLQEVTVETLYPGLGLNWRRVCTQRDFYYKGARYKYAVGQPMGLLSSWPVFALTHHAIALMASAKAFAEVHGFYPRRIKPMHAIVGDDIVLKDYRVKLEYQKILEYLGIKYTEVTHLETDSFEMCKRYILRGQDVSPVTWDVGSYNILLLSGLTRQEGIKIPPSRIGQLRWKQRNWKMYAFNPLSYLGNNWGISPELFSSVYQEELAHLVHTWVRKVIVRSPSRFALTKRFSGSRVIKKRIEPLNHYFRRIICEDFHKTTVEFMNSENYKEFRSRQTPRDRVFLGFGGEKAIVNTFKSILLERVYSRLRTSSNTR